MYLRYRSLVRPDNATEDLHRAVVRATLNHQATAGASVKIIQKEAGSKVHHRHNLKDNTQQHLLSKSEVFKEESFAFVVFSVYLPKK